MPETLQTAYGALTTALDLRSGQSLLVRGGTSALGLAAAALAVDRGCRVLATSRRRAGLELLAARGVEAVLDDGAVAGRVRKRLPGGVDAVLELVGAPTLRDCLAATAVHGTVCFAGMLSDSWTIPDFYPMDWIPTGVRLTTYAGEAHNLPASGSWTGSPRARWIWCPCTPTRSRTSSGRSRTWPRGRTSASSSVCPGAEGRPDRP